MRVCEKYKTLTITCKKKKVYYKSCVCVEVNGEVMSRHVFITAPPLPPPPDLDCIKGPVTTTGTTQAVTSIIGSTSLRKNFYFEEKNVSTEVNNKLFRLKI